MKRIMATTVLCLYFACNNVFAQSNFMTAVEYYTTNAISEINNGNYNDAANSFESAIEVFYTEADKIQNREAFYIRHLDLILDLIYDQLWCFALILEKGTVKNFSVLMESVNSSSRLILSSPVKPKNFTIENAYVVIGIIKYKAGQGYREELSKGGTEGLRFMQRIRNVKEEYGTNYEPAIKPIFSIKTNQKITRKFIEGVLYGIGRAD